MIDLNGWEQALAYLERGQTMRYNHQECPAGEDTRRRLYLTRPASSPGVVLAFCHNCQDKGIYTDGADKFKDFNAAPAVEYEGVEFDVPPDLVPCEHLAWPTAAQHWRIEKRLSIEDCYNAGIMYDPATHRVYLPMMASMTVEGQVEKDTELQGYQLRRLDGPGAKYLTAVKNKSTKPSTVIGRGPACTYLVEDLASGIVMQRSLRLNNYRNANVLVNYGVKCTPEVLIRGMNTEYNVVWLDNDGDHIEDAARIIARTWQLLRNVPCYIEDQYSDPKAVDDDAITAVHKYWQGYYND